MLALVFNLSSSRLVETIKSVSCSVGPTVSVSRLINRIRTNYLLSQLYRDCPI